MAKYAWAENIRITLAAAENRITLTIRDDGKGFDPANLREGGNGVNNMQQHAATLQGKISISSGVGRGTEIELTLVAV